MEGSYPTYEEWKQMTLGIITYNNGRFLSYLWGMETIKKKKRIFAIVYFSSYPTYEEWKHKSMFKLLKCVSFLSYLWGMETPCIPIIFSLVFCSYPTYEEWKLIFEGKVVQFYAIVLILPMRNGNLRKTEMRFWKKWKVLILPMRNGNSVSIIEHLVASSLVLILPMRNGNIKYQDYLSRCQKTFLSYLWGMETLDILVCQERHFLLVLILPMRNGNHYKSWNARLIEIVLILPMRNGNLKMLILIS